MQQVTEDAAEFADIDSEDDNMLPQLQFDGLQQLNAPSTVQGSTASDETLNLYLSGNVTKQVCSNEILAAISRNRNVRIRISVLEFWDRAEGSYPQLASFARSYICVPPTSVSCERLFSNVGQMCTVQRNRFNTENIRRRTCAKFWIAYFEK